MTQIEDSGVIEDRQTALQVDFANKYIGGGVISGVRTPNARTARTQTHTVTNTDAHYYDHAHTHIHTQHRLNHFRQGCVQEEIRFSINPECLASCLLCEVMQPDEAVLIVGTECFSKYKGYAGSLCFGGDHIDATPVYAHLSVSM